MKRACPHWRPSIKTLEKRLAQLEQAATGADDQITIYDVATGQTRRLNKTVPGGCEIIVRRGAPPPPEHQVILRLQPGYIEKLLSDE